MNLLLLLFCILGLAHIPTVSAAKSFNVLTYNVAGLPGIISSSDPAENTPHISSRLAPFSIINVQEDFNYHAALYASDKHPHRTATTGGVPFGSGLNTLSDFPFIDLERVKWDKCNLNSGDCLTPKGFTALKLQIEPGVYVDLYNLHTDAGGDQGDYDARRSNVNQLHAFLKTYSAGMPAIIMGDSNMRYTTAGDSMRALSSGAGFTDAWVQLSRNGVEPTLGAPALGCPFPFPPNFGDYNSCETVDKILSRSSPATSLEPVFYGNVHEQFLHPTTGEPLSDHYPLSAVYSYEPNYYLSDPVGGPHGTWFSDTAVLDGAKSATKITISGASRLDRVSVTYSDASLSTHGGTGGTQTAMAVSSTSTVSSIKACQEKHKNSTRVFFLEIVSSSGSKISAGKPTSECTTWTPPKPNSRLAGFWGRSGDEIDRIAPVWSL